MIIDIPISREQAELLVELLENNFTRVQCDEPSIEPSGVGADFAVYLRKQFGMGEQVSE